MDIEKYQSQFSNLELIYSDIFHDRFLVLDKKIIYHLGTSINHAGKRTFAINKLEEIEMKNSLLAKIKSLQKET